MPHHLIYFSVVCQGCWTLESPWDCKEIKLVNPKGNQPWILIGRTDAKVEAPIIWPPDEKSPLIRKDPDARKHGRQKEKRVTKDEMVGWHHWPNGHEFEQAPGVGDGQGRLVCFSPWSHKELDTPEWLNWTDWFQFSAETGSSWFMRADCEPLFLRPWPHVHSLKSVMVEEFVPWQLTKTKTHSFFPQRTFYWTFSSIILIDMFLGCDSQQQNHQWEFVRKWFTGDYSRDEGIVGE